MRTEQQVFDYYYGEEGDGHKEYDYLCEEVDNFEELLSKFANIDFILSAPDVVANSIVSFEDECYKLLESMKNAVIHGKILLKNSKKNVRRLRIGKMKYVLIIMRG